MNDSCRGRSELDANDRPILLIKLDENFVVFFWSIFACNLEYCLKTLSQVFSTYQTCIDTNFQEMATEEALEFPLNLP